MADDVEGSLAATRDGLAGAVSTDEVGRRLVHVAGAVVPLAHVVGLLGWPALQRLFVAGLLLATGLEILRLLVGLEWWLFRELTRAYERSNPAGYFLFVLGSTVAVLVYEPRIAVPAVLLLAIVDPISGLLADNEFSEPKRPAVLAVTFVLSAAIAAQFVPPVAAGLGALATTLADGVTPVVRGHAIDDNLTIPIGAGAAMWVGLQLLG